MDCTQRKRTSISNHWFRDLSLTNEPREAKWDCILLKINFIGFVLFWERHKYGHGPSLNTSCQNRLTIFLLMLGVQMKPEVLFYLT